MGQRRRMPISPGGVLVAMLAAALAGCGISPTSPTPPSPPPSSIGLSAVAHAYIDEMVGLMQAHSINRHRIDWVTFREAVFAAAPNAQKISDLYTTAIPAALGRLGDHHSDYITAGGSTIWNPIPPGCFDRAVLSLGPQAGVGYVRVGTFDGADWVGFATSIETQIRAADAPDLVGWIVDVRGNTGGNMWPMVAGVGSILGEGIAGAFVDPDGNVSLWGYRDGASFVDGASVVQVPNPYRLYQAAPRVAVLTDCLVASSGEAVAIAFRGRPNTRSFGTATRGLSTSNEEYPLSDGATLLLTVSTMADRNLTVFGHVVVPDELTPTPDETVQAALAWLRGS
jgi:carboxyl-terminal processing protease